MVIKSIWFILLILCSAWGDDLKTPRSIEAIFKGRCNEYQEVLRPELFPLGVRSLKSISISIKSKQKNCATLWELFKKAFASKSPCDVPPENYEEFSNAADHEIDTFNKVMLWSGRVFPFVEEFSGNTRRYLLIRDLLAIYVIKNIESWCGTTKASGIEFFEICPQLGSCPNNAVSSFWMHMSKKFALKARGDVHVMLSASTGTAFNADSIFGKMELPNLSQPRTPKLIVHLVRNLDEQPKETCNSGSLLTLKKLVEQKKIVFECRENERDIRLLQCMDNLDKKDCKLLI